MSDAAIWRRQAQAIVNDLFVNGSGQQADRLVLTVDGPPKRDLGGWGRLPALHRIEAALRACADAPPTAKRELTKEGAERLAEELIATYGAFLSNNAKQPVDYKTLMQIREGAHPGDACSAAFVAAIERACADALAPAPENAFDDLLAGFDHSVAGVHLLDGPRPSYEHYDAAEWHTRGISQGLKIARTILVENIRLLAEALAPAAENALNRDGDPLHTGDDERIDLVSSIIASAEELRDGSCVDEDIIAADNIVEDCRKLDALLLATIQRERAADALAPATESEVAYQQPVEDMVTKMAEKLTDEAPRYSLADRIAQWRKQAGFVDPPDEGTLGGMYASGRAFAFERCADEAELFLKSADALAPPEPGWQPISSAPKDRSKFWAVNADGDQFVCANADYANRERWHNLSANRWDRPTHWQLLPAPPRADALEAPRQSDPVKETP